MAARAPTRAVAMEGAVVVAARARRRHLAMDVGRGGHRGRRGESNDAPPSPSPSSMFEPEPADMFEFNVTLYHAAGTRNDQAAPPVRLGGG
jgi:hypothetical protein